MLNKVVVIGAIPEPIGGVSEFVYRLACKDKGERISRIVDLYPENNKKRLPPGVSHLVGPRGMFRFPWLWGVLLFSRCGVLHFNFSSTRILFLFLLFPKRIGVKWFLTLHNGSLKKPKILPYWLFRFVLSRFTLIFSLSEVQYKFYLRSGVDENKIRKGSSYIFLKEESEVDDVVYRRWKNKAEKFRVNYVASGYATAIYNHIWSLEKLSTMKDCSLSLFLYGDRDQAVWNEIQKYSSFENIEIFWKVDGSTFNKILSEADVYLRPNSVDSFGIAVADAVNFGVKVIASDVCERYPGAQTFKGKEQFFYCIEQIDVDADLHVPLNRGEGTDSMELYREAYDEHSRR